MYSDAHVCGVGKEQELLVYYFFVRKGLLPSKLKVTGQLGCLSCHTSVKVGFAPTHYGEK